MTELAGIADKFTDDSNFRNKFIAAPWTSEDATASRSPTTSTSP